MLSKIVRYFDRRFTARVEADPHPEEHEAGLRATAVDYAPKDLARLASMKTELHRFWAIPRATLAAHTLGRVDEARALATEALELAAKYPSNGSAINAAHTVLGLIALDDGDVVEAIAALERSSDITEGSPDLDSFGPSMRLAKALLGRGETQAVLRYFERCGGFWKMGTESLDIWTAKVKKGGIPVFFHNA
jgi:hypothetical protein